MDFTNRLLRISFFIILILCSFISLVVSQGKAEKVKKDTINIVSVKGCEGVKVTQCELAMGLITTLKMGESLICEEAFVHLRALGIAPGEDWSYGDPHKVVTVEEIMDVIIDIQRAYNEGNVPLDGFEVANEVNRFCLDMKGPLPAPQSEAKEGETTPDAGITPPPSSPPPGEAEKEKTTPDEDITPPKSSPPPPSEDEKKETPPTSVPQKEGKK